jgi:hypothetical protein
VFQKYPSFYDLILKALNEHKNELEERQKQLRELGLQHFSDR